MEIVHAVFQGARYATEVWLSDAALRSIKKHLKGNEHGPFMAKLKRVAQAGFAEFEGAQAAPVKHEWDGVYRFGHRLSLFRLLGFFEGGRSEFIGVRGALKRGQKLSKRDREMIDEVARIRKTHDWRKV